MWIYHYISVCPLIYLRSSGIFLSLLELMERVIQSAYLVLFFESKSYIYTFYSAVYNIVPCSDMAGEIIQVGELVTEWKVGDRVMPNFIPLLQHGVPVNPEQSHSSFGGFVDGTLTDYKAVLASVSSWMIFSRFLVPCSNSVTVLGPYSRSSLVSGGCCYGVSLARVRPWDATHGVTFRCTGVTVYNALTATRPVKAGDWILVQGNL